MTLKGLCVLSSFFVLALQTACVWRGAVKDDALAAPFQANDYTALIEGCGNQPIVGYTYCRKASGSPTSDKVVFHFPPVKCFPIDPISKAPRTSCISGKVFFADGSPAYGFEVPFDVTSYAVDWKTLTHKDLFEKSDRGFWGYEYEILWVDTDNHEQKSFLQGEIRLRVYDTAVGTKAYLPLDQVHADTNFVWTWIDNGVNYKMTSSGRATTW